MTAIQQSNKKAVALIQQLRATKNKKGMSDYRLALLTGLSQSTITRIFNDDQIPSIANTINIANVLGFIIKLENQ